MAIIEDVGLEVQIITGGSAAAEYPDEEPGADEELRPSRTRHVYVMSSDGVTFYVRIKVHAQPGAAGWQWVGQSSSNRLVGAVTVDGVHKTRSLLANRDQGDRVEGIHCRKTHTMRKFCFAPVSTVDDANKRRVAADMKTARKLGLIRVGIWRCTLTGATPPRARARSARKTESAPDGISVAEKALKGRAVSHGTMLSPPVTHYREACDVRYRDSEPLAVFYFRYRSKEALEQLLIISRPKSPSPASDVDNLSSVEIRRLARERLAQIKRVKKRAASVKDEDGDGDGIGAVKSERPWKIAKTTGGKEVIDLTANDDDEGSLA